MPELIGLRGGKHHADTRLRAAFQHVLAFLVETGNDRVVVIEGDDHGRQWNRVVAAVLPEAGIRWERDTRQAVNPAQTLDPGAILSLSVPGEKAPVAPHE